ncbi:MAG: M36 family metallopeptidase [Pyrinomonadaceae bacterium]
MRTNRELRWIGAIVLVLVVSVLTWNFLQVVSSQENKSRAGRKGESHSPENFDIRYDHPKEKMAVADRLKQNSLAEGSERSDALVKRAETMKEAEAKLARKIPDLQVKYNEELRSPEIVGVSKGKRFLTPPSGKVLEKVLRDFLRSNQSLYGLGDQELDQYKERVTATNPDGNLSWVFLEREINGLPVFRSEITAMFTRNNELARTVGEITYGLEEHLLSKMPAMSAQGAVAAAANSLGIAVDPASLVVKESDADGTRFVFDRGQFSDDTTVELQYFPIEPGVASLAWVVTLWQDNPAYLIAVGADNGELFFRKNITADQTQPASYTFYDNDSPAPASPSDSLPSATTQGASIARSTISVISEHPSNNLGWLTDGGTTTTGNNVDAGIDAVGPNGIDPGSRPVSATRVFDFAYDPGPGFPVPGGEDPTLPNYRFGEVVNMFVWSNRYHDRLYGAGFTEPFRNFQTDNFGRGGLGNDFVRAEGQDSSGTNNANFATPPDGSLPRMQMFRFTGPTPDRSSGLDQEILIHELTHGTSNRLHANAAGLNRVAGGGMGEGWGDFYGRLLLSTAAEDINGVFGAGGYSTFLITGPTYESNYYYGIRRFPYALKTTLGTNGKPHNPLTLADIDQSKIDLTDGAFPRGPIGSSSAAAVHNIGEVWCVTLLEVRARIIARMGFAAGNQRMLQLATDAMKIDPADPSLLDGRDALLAASLASGGGGDELLEIWSGFATRGMGFGSAMTNPSGSPISVTESFDLPNLQLGNVSIASEDCPDQNGAADPGETVELAVELTNPLGDATGVTAQIVGGGNATYGTIAAGGSATRDISYTVPADAECGSTITLTIEIDSSHGPVTKTYELQIGVPTGTGPLASHTTGSITTPIPDVSTVEIPINVPDTGPVADVNVSFRLNHTFDGDLEIALVAPDGTSVSLANNRGGGGNDFGTGANDCSGVLTKFDDSAAGPISGGSAPFAGTFRPESPLSGLTGSQMNGTWKLRISDQGALDVGTVGCVQLELSEQFYFCCGVAGDPVIDEVPPAILLAEGNSPANNAPDPGEIVTMDFPFANVGSGPTTNLVATLQPGGGVLTPSGPQSYGRLVPGEPAVARPFTFEVSRDIPCGGDIIATFQLQDGAVDLGLATFTIRAGSTVGGETSGSNAAPIAIPGTGTGGGATPQANPYPSSINIAGSSGTVVKVTATLTGFSHTFPGDVDILLVGPGGQKVMLMSDVGGGTDAVGANLTFDDTAGPVVSPVVSGTFRPTNSGATDPFPAPAPAGPNGSLLSIFNSLDPNGTWSLYVVDDAGADVGSISGGWGLTVTTEDPFCIDPPVISNLTVSKSVLWPPNHNMVNVGVSWNVSDPDGVAVSRIDSITSNEPVNGTDDGNTAPDWEIVNPFQPNARVRLRAERSGIGTGRIYTITVYVEDAVGHSTTRSTTVIVPLSMGN